MPQRARPRADHPHGTRVGRYACWARRGDGLEAGAAVRCLRRRMSCGRRWFECAFAWAEGPPDPHPPASSPAATAASSGAERRTAIGRSSHSPGSPPHDEHADSSSQHPQFAFADPDRAYADTIVNDSDRQLGAAKPLVQVRGVDRDVERGDAGGRIDARLRDRWDRCSERCMPVAPFLDCGLRTVREPPPRPYPRTPLRRERTRSSPPGPAVTTSAAHRLRRRPMS